MKTAALKKKPEMSRGDEIVEKLRLVLSTCKEKASKIREQAEQLAEHVGQQATTDEK